MFCLPWGLMSKPGGVQDDVHGAPSFSTFLRALEGAPGLAPAREAALRAVTPGLYRALSEARRDEVGPRYPVQFQLLFLFLFLRPRLSRPA